MSLITYLLPHGAGCLECNLEMHSQQPLSTGLEVDAGLRKMDETPERSLEGLTLKALPPRPPPMHLSLSTSPSARVLFATWTGLPKGCTAEQSPSLAPRDHEVVGYRNTAFHFYSPGTQHRAWHRAGARGDRVE